MKPGSDRALRGGRWAPIDDFLAAVEPDPILPRTFREADERERWDSEHSERWDGQEPGWSPDIAAQGFEAALARILGGRAGPCASGPLPYCACAESERGAVTMDPASFQMGPPAGRRVRNDSHASRPLRSAVDAWLRAGGWGRGKDGAGSLALSGLDSPEARDQIEYQWRWELTCRGWNGGYWIFRRWNVEPDGSTRMYWWTTERAPAVPPPPPDA